MKRRVESWTVEQLMKQRERISFPEYQRQRDLWSEQAKALLVDSILKDIDIPKLYFNETQDRSYEVIDGQQRLWAIWQFVGDEYPIGQGTKEKTFLQLTAEERKHILAYELTITILRDADDAYLRELFLRLQLGLLLVPGEKLHAATGEMKDFIFGPMFKHAWVKDLKIPARRYAKETLCAQIAINVFSLARTKTFSRTRYDDLQHFVEEYERPVGEDRTIFRSTTKHIDAIMEALGGAFGNNASKLTNRSYALSVFLLAEDLFRSEAFRPKTWSSFVEFTLLFWKKLREEISLGLARESELLFRFESMLSNAPGERYQIERRHTILKFSFHHFGETGKLPTRYTETND